MSTNATLPQAGHILTLIDQKGVSKEQLAVAVSDGILPDFLEALATGFNKPRGELRDFLGLGPLVLKVVVDYSMTLAEMIASGRYDWKNDDITTERFPVKGKGKVETTVELIHLNRVIATDEVKKEIDKMGMRPATMEELLAFGATFPEVQRRFPIIALGSVSQLGDFRDVPFLDVDDSERGLSLDWSDDEWGERCRFLAVRK